MSQTEEQPLLDGTSSVPQSCQTVDLPLAVLQHEDRRRKRFMIIMCTTTVIGGFGLFFEIAPLLKIYEDIVCEEYYKRDMFPNSTMLNMLGVDCSVEPVQSEVAYILGWSHTLNVIPGMLFALPFGILADRVGRKPVLLCNCFAALLQSTLVKIICYWQLPLRLIWLAPLAQVIGGGSGVATSITYSMIADLYPVEMRTTIFSRLTSLFLVIALLGPSLGASMMEKWGAWFTLWTSVVLSAISFGLTFEMPETLRHADIGVPVAVDTTADLDTTRHISRLYRSGLKAIEFFNFIWTNNRLLITLLSLTILSFAQQSGLFLLLYIARRLDLSIAQTTPLLSIQTAIMLLLAIAVLPYLSHTLVSRKRLLAVQLDLYTTRASLFCITAGFFIIGFSDNLPLTIFGIVFWSLGCCVGITARSFAATLVKPTQIGILYVGLSVLESMASCIGSPVLAVAFRLGIKLGSWLQGLPFIVAGAASMLALVVIFIISPLE